MKAVDTPNISQEIFQVQRAAKGSGRSGGFPTFSAPFFPSLVDPRLIHRVAFALEAHTEFEERRAQEPRCANADAMQ